MSLGRNSLHSHARRHSLLRCYNIPLYLNANCSKWWQPPLKTERGPEIPSTTQPAPLQTSTEPALVIPDSYSPVSLFVILAIGTCFHIKLRSERSFNDDTYSMAVLFICWQISVFANFCPFYSKLPIEERPRAPQHRHLSETWDTVITPSNIIILLARVRSVSWTLSNEFPSPVTCRNKRASSGQQIRDHTFTIEWTISMTMNGLPEVNLQGVPQ